MKNKNKLTDLSVGEASEKLGVSTRTVINYIKSKEITAIKVGKSWYINKASLDSFILKYKFNPKDIKTTNNEIKEDTNNKKYSVKDLRLFIKISELIPYGCFNTISLKEEMLTKVSNLHLAAFEYIGAGYYSFGAANKMHHYEKSREKVAGIIAILYGEKSKDSKIQEFLNKIEDDLLPVYSSLIKRMDKKIERPKNL
jgi:excisionase family DNA binding protein